MAKLIVKPMEDPLYYPQQGDTFLLPNNNTLFMVTEVDAVWIRYIILLVDGRQCGASGRINVSRIHDLEWVFIDEITTTRIK